MNNDDQMTVSSYFWYLVALMSIGVIFHLIGGCDRTSDRALPETTPHGVHGVLEGEHL